MDVSGIDGAATQKLLAGIPGDGTAEHGGPMFTASRYCSCKVRPSLQEGQAISRSRSPWLALAALLAALHSVSAEAAASTLPSSSGDDIKEGDNIFLDTDSGIFTLVSGAQVGEPPANSKPVYFCAPARARFVVQSIVAASSKAASASNPSESDTVIVRGYFPEGGPGFKNGLHFANTVPPTDGMEKHPACGGTQWVSLGTTYQFTEENFKKVVNRRAGFTWGAMVIPYKYYFTDHSIKGNPSTVAYAGYEGWFPGVSLALVGAAGLGVAPSSSNSPSTTVGGGAGSSSDSSSTSATYTVAFGLIATFGKSIKAGVVAGRDYQSNAAGFKYENKTWLALSVGAGF
jgi:hypothetical protein